MLVNRASPAPSNASSCTLGGTPEPEEVFGYVVAQLNILPCTINPGLLTPKSGEMKRRYYSPEPSNGFSNKKFRAAVPLEVIALDEDEDSAIVPFELGDDDIVIDLEEIGEDMENAVFEEENFGNAQGPLALRKRNSPIMLPCMHIETYRHNSASLKVGKTIELDDGTFLFIKAMIQDLETDQVSLRGWLLKRCTDMDGLLEKKANELCFIHEIDLDDQRPMLEQSVVEVNLERVIKVRHVIRTNRPFPECRFDPCFIPQGTHQEQLTHIRENERLVVRLMYITTFENSLDRVKNEGKPNNFRARKLICLAEEDCSPGMFISREELRRNWRGETILGGSSVADRPARKARVQEEAPRQHGRQLQLQPLNEEYQCHICGKWYSLPEQLLQHHQERHEAKKPQKPKLYKQKTGEPKRDGDDDVQIIEKEAVQFKSSLSGVRRTNHSRGASQSTENILRRYTYGESFSGAGGMTRGAVMAGLKVLWGMDFNPNACETWRKNFPFATLYEMWSHEFVALVGLESLFVVDILHLSPPCQVFSPAKTRAGKDDEMNFASLFAVMALIQKSKPRIITLEQTFGILHRKFRQAFNSVIHMFTSLGFSVSWQVIELQRFGLAQRRRRLIIMASCPGETLPDVPPCTHSENGPGGLKPYATPRSFLAHIPRNAPNHDIRAACTGKIYPVWDDLKITKCITTNGGENSGYPDGGRALTHREFAALQGFPLEHVFYGNDVRRQIGNAVPPMVSKILLSWVRRHLEKVDGVA